MAMKVSKNYFVELWDKFRHSCWRMALCDVLTQWLTGAVLALVGLWMMKALFSVPISSIIDLIPLPISSVEYDHILIIVIPIIAIQIHFRHKQHKNQHIVTELIFDEKLTYKSKLQQCDLNIKLYEGLNDILAARRSFLLSLSPIPIVTAILGYIFDKVDLINIQLEMHVFFCVGLIVVYAFLMHKNFRKLKANHLQCYRWQEAKYQIITLQERRKEKYH